MNLSKNMNIMINMVISIIAIMLFITGLTLGDPVKKLLLKPINDMPKCYWDLRCVDNMCVCLFPIFDGNPGIYCWDDLSECLMIKWKELFINLCIAIIGTTNFIILSLAGKSATPEELANFNYHWTNQFNDRINNMCYYDHNGNIRIRQAEDSWRSRY
ncbi:hypothetical protein CE11_00969 [Megavirus courdo11]|uniref:Uncharacterized protein n=1 Tax=Megavirus courdo11 TaxID=1128140 RepID=K7YA81_9VIRU|nr:hypothetical protein CE11_00969 [Megavirus courdo11]